MPEENNPKKNYGIYDHDHENEITLFGKTKYRDESVKFGIRTDDRRKHMYVLGKTGMGKTNLLYSLIMSDIKKGHGVAVVDSHGELVKDILKSIPKNRINDVVLFDPADVEYPVSFNILEIKDQKEKHLIASGLMSVFTKIWAGVWSARMEYILNNCVLALLDFHGSTMLGIPRLLTDSEYRKKVISKVSDPVVKSFWMDEYANYNERFRSEAIAPIQNKVGQFLSTGMIRNIVSQPKSKINLREIMDDGKILLMDLSKGKVGEDNARLLGAMMVTRIQLAAMSRVDTPEDERRDFYLYVDEFQNVATESFANILSEARKYHLNLIIAHQYLSQLDDSIKEAVLGNVGTLMLFRIGAQDADELESEFEPIFTKNDLLNLSKYTIYLKLMINGMTSDAFSANTLYTPPENTENIEKILSVSRERYAQKREIVEERILRWSQGTTLESSTAIKRKAQPMQKPIKTTKRPSQTKSPLQKPGNKTSISPRGQKSNNRSQLRRPSNAQTALPGEQNFLSQFK